MMYESYYSPAQTTHFMYHNALLSNRATLIFIHGMGDSGISYQKFLTTPQLQSFNILIPDLLGHGRSSSANDYSFTEQITSIVQHVQFVLQQAQVKINNLVLIGHSMGGVIATLLCESELKPSIKGLVNIEGNLTPYGAFASAAAVKAAEQNRFLPWLEDFIENKIYHQLGNKFYSARNYYASLKFCRPEAFLQSSKQLCELAVTLAGKHYAELTMPRIYCYGDQSISVKNLKYLQEHSLTTMMFHCASHWPMIECFDEFMKFLLGFLQKILPA